MFVLLRSGAVIELTQVPPGLRWPLAALWLFAVCNAFNLLDIMDGLAAGVGAVAALAFGVVALTTGEYPEAAASLRAGRARWRGFLVFNVPPGADLPRGRRLAGGRPHPRCARDRDPLERPQRGGVPGAARHPRRAARRHRVRERAARPRRQAVLARQPGPLPAPPAPCGWAGSTAQDRERRSSRSRVLGAMVGVGTAVLWPWEVGLVDPRRVRARFMVVLLVVLARVRMEAPTVRRVVIVGAGLTGLSAAYHLRGRGVGPAVLENARTRSAARAARSSATGSHFDLTGHLLHLARAESHELLRAARRARRAAAPPPAGRHRARRHRHAVPDPDQHLPAAARDPAGLPARVRRGARARAGGAAGAPAILRRLGRSTGSVRGSPGTSSSPTTASCSAPTRRS